MDPDGIGRAPESPEGRPFRAEARAVVDLTIASVGSLVVVERKGARRSQCRSGTQSDWVDNDQLSFCQCPGACPAHGPPPAFLSSLSPMALVELLMQSAEALGRGDAGPRRGTMKACQTELLERLHGADESETHLLTIARLIRDSAGRHLTEQDFRLVVGDGPLTAGLERKADCRVDDKQAHEDAIDRAMLGEDGDDG